MLLPANASDPAAMMAQAMSIYKGVVGPGGTSTHPSRPSPGSAFESSTKKASDSEEHDEVWESPVKADRNNNGHARKGDLSVSAPSFGTDPLFSLQNPSRVSPNPFSLSRND